MYRFKKKNWFGTQLCTQQVQTKTVFSTNFADGHYFPPTVQSEEILVKKVNGVCMMMMLDKYAVQVECEN